MSRNSRDIRQGQCVGQISEISEADYPHRPVGCPAQAWSVAEVLRAHAAIELATERANANRANTNRANTNQANTNR